MKQIAFSGTLDPITNGHMWVIGEARSLADEVTVFLSENPFKKPWFSAEQRKHVIEQSAALRGWDNVNVVIVKGDYTARAAKKHGIDYLIRGIRNTADFDYENLIQQTNVDVLHGAKTIFVMPPRDLGSVSSSFVKALEGPVGWNWSMKKFVPLPAYETWILDWLRRQWDSLWRYAQAQPDAARNIDKWFDYLTGPASHRAPGRHYHNLDHLVHGLTEIKVWAANAEVPPRDVDTLRKAFWFHDAVHEHSKNPVTNEEASARLWLGSGLDAEAEPAGLIRATDHFQETSIDHRLKHVMLGADLAILGQDADVYMAYALAIQAEYAHVPASTYRENRRKALVHLHAKAQANQLFADPYFARQYNEKAKSNMAEEIAALARS
jgi:pantetheine-phosphate adenylyltransferase